MTDPNVPKLAERVQAYLRASAAQRYDVEPAPPFTCYFNPLTDFPHFNYAIPDAAPDCPYAAGLASLRACFAARARVPRFEFVEICAPGLPAVLEADGFALESRQQLMVCTLAQFRPPQVPSGLATQPVYAGDSDALLADYWRVQTLGFGGTAVDPIPELEVAGLRATLTTGTAFLARLGDEPAGVAMLTAPLDGVTELVAVTTLPALRRRGIARMLSAVAIAAAFDAGVNLVCLTAADPTAERVYSAIGFAPAGTMLAYSLPAPA